MEELNDFLSFGEVQNAIISIDFLKLELFKVYCYHSRYTFFLYYYECCFEIHYSSNLDKVQVQNRKYYNRFQYNVDFKEASELKLRYVRPRKIK